MGICHDIYIYYVCISISIQWRNTSWVTNQKPTPNFFPIGPNYKCKNLTKYQRQKQTSRKCKKTNTRIHKDQNSPCEMQYTLFYILFCMALHSILHVQTCGVCSIFSALSLAWKYLRPFMPCVFVGMLAAYLLHVNVWKASWDSPWIYLTPLIEIESEGRTQKFWYILNRTWHISSFMVHLVHLHICWKPYLISLLPDSSEAPSNVAMLCQAIWSALRVSYHAPWDEITSWKKS